MEKINGIIWIKNTVAGSKSDGNKAYFIDAEFNHYLLYRKGIYEINDSFFYPYHLKTVEVLGEIQKQKWIMVESIELIKDSIESEKIEEVFVFNKSVFKDILNSDGPILNIVEQKCVTQEGADSCKLWLRAHVDTGVSIFAKVNETALLFFFQGRLSVRELFLLSNDEPYMIEERIDKKYVFKKESYSEQLDNNYLKKISWADMHFYSIEKGIRLENPFEELMKKLELFWLNAHKVQ